MLSSSTRAVLTSPWKPGRSRFAGNLRASNAAAKWPVPSNHTALGLGGAENWSDGLRARRLWLAKVTPENLLLSFNRLWMGCGVSVARRIILAQSMDAARDSSNVRSKDHDCTSSGIIRG